MLQTIARRRAAAKDAAQKVAPNKIDLINVLLKNIYWNGFERRGTSFRIARSRLRDLADVQRLEAGTMRKIVERVRREGFILYPIDKSDYALARLWGFDKLENHTNLPLVEDDAIRNAERRTEDV
jgi:hypothetical protein